MKKGNLYVFITAALLIFCTSTIYAQAGTLDNSFNANDNGGMFANGTHGTVSVIRAQSSGKIIIGGGFFKYRGVAVSNIV